MAVYDLEEQDQLEDLKSWWKQWGNTVAGVIIAVVLVMQPAMGAGFMALKTPTPLKNGLRSLANHVVYGAGLYVAAVALAPRAA